MPHSGRLPDRPPHVHVHTRVHTHIHMRTQLPLSGSSLWKVKVRRGCICMGLPPSAVAVICLQRECLPLVGWFSALGCGGVYRYIFASSCFNTLCFCDFFRVLVYVCLLCVSKYL